jgi:hypothetical protein
MARTGVESLSVDLRKDRYRVCVELFSCHIFDDSVGFLS